MKRILFTLFLLFTSPIVGCTLLGQSNAAHHAVEDYNYDVDKVVVKVANGKKTVTVFLLHKVDEKGVEEIKAIVKDKIPDAEEVRIKSR